ncbi:zinc finger MYM-type protein 1 [Trichonephila clavipes]|nr:zinc finger MYM-type protein 1 [Trichonephila clavipes]
MLVILRYCSTSTGSIEKNLIGFLAATETIEEYLTNAILGELEKNGLDIQNCRGQRHDNGVNVVGINSGVNTRVLNIIPGAFFTPCGFHSWNLILYPSEGNVRHTLHRLSNKSPNRVPTPLLSVAIKTKRLELAQTHNGGQLGKKCDPMNIMQ